MFYFILLISVFVYVINKAFSFMAWYTIRTAKRKKYLRLIKDKNDGTEVLINNKDGTPTFVKILQEDRKKLISFSSEEREKIIFFAETHIDIYAEIVEHLGWGLVASIFRPSFFSTFVSMKKLKRIFMFLSRQRKTYYFNSSLKSSSTIFSSE